MFSSHLEMHLLSREVGRLGNNDWKLFWHEGESTLPIEDGKGSSCLATPLRAGAKECCHLTLDLSSVGVHLNKDMGFRFARKVVFVTSWS